MRRGQEARHIIGMPNDDDRFEPSLSRSRRDSGGIGSGKSAGRNLRGKVLEQVARRSGNPRGSGGLFAPAKGKASGRFNARGRGAKVAASLPRGSGWSFDHASGIRVRPRRVTVKARVVKLAGEAAAVQKHLGYLERDGVTRDGEPARFYSTFADEVDGQAFAERGQGDRHHFRFIISPEDGPEFENLKSFTRDLMAKMEQDLETTLDWVAVDHFDTGLPHTHILVRGKTEEGKTLNIAGDYIAHGIRARASEIMTRDLGPQSEMEVRQQLGQEVEAERLTRLDRTILAQAKDNLVDLTRIEGPMAGDAAYQQQLVGRARVLERMELAEKTGPLTWKLDPDIEQTLGDMGRRGDIIRTLHREMTTGKWRELPSLKLAPEIDPRPVVIHGPSDDRTGEPEQTREPIIGKVLKRGAADEEHERRYLVVDGIDGRSHYVDIGGNAETTPVGSLVRLEAKQAALRVSDTTVVEVAAASGGQYSVQLHLKHDANATQDFAEAHVRRLEAIRRATGRLDREPSGVWNIAPDHLDTVMAYERGKQRTEPFRIEVLSPKPIEHLAGVQAETWLDRELVAENKNEIAGEGYGGEVRKALDLRRQWLIEQQMASAEGTEVIYNRNLLRLLREREVRAVGAQMASDLGIPFVEADTGKRVEGIYRRSVGMVSGKFAVVERSRDFTLVPWRPELEKQVGKNVSGVVREVGGVNWTIGRQRSAPGIS